MRRMGWFFLVLGISLGIIFGLYYAWEIGPLDPKDALPADLQDQYQEELRTLIAIAYARTGDINRAARRLDMLSIPSDSQALKGYAEQLLAEGRPEQDVRAVAQLSAALATEQAKPRITATRTSVPTSSPTVPATNTPLPTETATPIPSYQLRSRDEICDPDLNTPLIQVSIFDSKGEPVPGIEIFVLWDDGEDHFFTGLKSEHGPGYGDFAMTEGISYTVQVAEVGESITGLGAVECLDDNDDPFPGSWLLSFYEP